jgi:hypothetical protein
MSIVGVTWPQEAHLSEGAMISCRLSMPNFELDFAAIVRYRSVRNTTTHLGLQFVELTPSQQDALSRAVSQLERLVLRSKRRGKSGT